MLLFAGTATITLEYDILEPLFGIRFWHGEFYLVFSLVLDVAGSPRRRPRVMMYRRAVGCACPSSTTRGPTGRRAIRISTARNTGARIGLSSGSW